MGTFGGLKIIIPPGLNTLDTLISLICPLTMFKSVHTYTMEELRILTVIFVTSQILYVYTYSDTHTKLLLYAIAIYLS